jgi:hypothetical protein
MTQPSQLLNLNVLKETSPPGILIDGSITDMGTFIGDDLEDYVIDSHTLSIQHIAADPSEGTFHNSQTMSKSAQETVTEYDRNVNVRFDSKLTVSEFESMQRFTTGANDSEQKPASVNILAPHNKQMASTESLQNANSTHLQPNSEEINSTSSVQNNLELMRGTQSYTEGEAHDAGSHQNIASGALGPPTSEITPLLSTGTTTDFNEDDVFAVEETVTVRIRRSVFLETTQRNSATPHQNVSFEVMEDVVDWGGVSTNSFSFGTAFLCIEKAVIEETSELPRSIIYCVILSG